MSQIVEQAGQKCWRTNEGDTLDQIAIAVYGTSAGTLEILAAANADLAQPVLTSGVMLKLPDIPKPQSRRVRQVFDATKLGVSK